jgi:hypothetical protein
VPTFHLNLWGQWTGHGSLVNVLLSRWPKPLLGWVTLGVTNVPVCSVTAPKNNY